MKYLLILGAFSVFTSIVHAQTFRAQQCVIENGVLKFISADYDPATGKSTVTINGSQKALDEVYPPTGTNYAASASWYVNNEKIIVNGRKYVKYGLPRVLGVTDIVKATEYNRVGVYVEAGATGVADVIYIPTRRGCEFQPYQLDKYDVAQKKVYYDEDWKVCSQSNATYYRLMTVDAAGKPVGLVKDFYINGTKQWQGSLSHVDLKDNNKDVMEGVCAWFYTNGTKSEEVYYVKGKQQGVYKSWTEDGSLAQEIEYKNGVVHGYIKTYSPEGQLLKTEHYTNGKLNGK